MEQRGFVGRLRNAPYAAFRATSPPCRGRSHPGSSRSPWRTPCAYKASSRWEETRQVKQRRCAIVITAGHKRADRAPLLRADNTPGSYRRGPGPAHLRVPRALPTAPCPRAPGRRSAGWARRLRAPRHKRAAPPPRHPPGPRPGPYQMELRILCRSALASLPCSPGTRAGRAPAGAGVPASRRGGCPSACCSSAMGARRRRGDAERAGRTRPLPQPSSESPSLAARGTSRAGSRAASRRYAAGWRARLAARRMAARSSSAAPAQGRSALPRFAAPGPARPAPPPPLLAPQPPCPPGRPVRRLGAARAGGPPAGRGLGPGWGGGAAAEGGEWRPPAAALGRPRGAGRGLGRTAGTAKADACARTDARLVRSRAWVARAAPSAEPSLRTREPLPRRAALHQPPAPHLSPSGCSAQPPILPHPEVFVNSARKRTPLARTQPSLLPKEAAAKAETGAAPRPGLLASRSARRPREHQKPLLCTSAAPLFPILLIPVSVWFIPVPNDHKTAQMALDVPLSPRPNVLTQLEPRQQQSFIFRGADPIPVPSRSTGHPARVSAEPCTVGPFSAWAEEWVPQQLPTLDPRISGCLPGLQWSLKMWAFYTTDKYTQCC